MQFILDQLTSTIGGIILGIFTAAYLHALWMFWHPTQIRLWGKWQTDPRFLTVVGILLAVGWIAMAWLSVALKP